MAVNKKGRYEIDRSKNNEFFWRFIKNGKQISRSSETYKRKGSVKRSIAIMQNSNGVETIDITKKK
jgi:uncharacterized protein YegP (UPF0339 family)